MKHHATESAPRPSLLNQAVLAEAVARIESGSTLDDDTELRQALAATPDRAAQWRWRAWLLGQRLGLVVEWGRLRLLGWGVLAALGVLMVFSSLGLTRAVLGEGRSINALAALVSLLGLHGLTLLAWLFAWLLPRHRASGDPVGRLALWLTARLPLGRGAHSLSLMNAFSAELRRHGLLRWLTGLISHGLWAASFVLVLMVLGFGFSFKSYVLSWETTILSGEFFVRAVQVTGALPAWLGFPVPDAANVLNAEALGVVAAQTQRAWGLWLIGCVLVYGLLPRALLAAWCAWRWRAGLPRLGQPDGRNPQVRRVLDRLDALESIAQVIDAERRVGADLPARAAAGAEAQGLCLLGFELPPEQPWPPQPDGFEARQPHWLALSGSAAERDQALLQLTRQPPAALVLACWGHSSPDRGTARFVRQLQPLAGRCALWLLGTSDTRAVQRWHDWLQVESLADGWTVVHEAQALEDWLEQVVQPSQQESAP